MKGNLLLVDDEQGLIEMVETLLKKEGFNNIYTARTAKETLHLLHQHSIDLIVLDVMLENDNGFDLCQDIRRITKIPIIFLSARTSDFDKITGLTVGGDDYITKPFNPMELLARIMAHLRRRSYNENLPTEGKVFNIGRFCLNVDEASLYVEGQKIKCPLKEFELLAFLCENPNRVFSLEHLYERVWKGESYGDERTVMVHIRRLRQKIERDPNQPEYLINVRGFGYKLVVNHEGSQ
ncbi:response regulator transcription factor [Halalkalibacterium halodurans]|uniref:response regulator transcription factor n=1 Tax=Halalkalibacterium halodurans TaxID=86665 RepID=UPI002E1D28B8|nr:response regulator transcription factor [Halalkalibacterium halodurans]